MVIWLYCIFSNEAEMLPFFLRHYAPQVDRLIMLDNGSTDDSADLIRAYPNATLEKYPADKAVMDSVSMAHFASTHYHEARGYADFVLWVDCDEFLWAGGQSLRGVLRGYQQQGIRAVRSRGYQMLADSFPSGTTPITEQIRYGIRDAEYDKVAIFDPELSIRFRPGRHNCRIDGASAQQGEVKLLHYRYLGADYLQRRNAYNFGNLSEAERQAGRSYHVASNHHGKYSLGWYQHAMLYMSDVITPEYIGALA